MFSFFSMRMAVESLTLKKLSKFLKKSVLIREIPMYWKLFGPWDKQIKIFHSKSLSTSFATKLVNTEQETDFKEFGDFTTKKTLELSDLSSLRRSHDPSDNIWMTMLFWTWCTASISTKRPNQMKNSLSMSFIKSSPIITAEMHENDSFLDYWKSMIMNNLNNLNFSLIED